MIPLEPASMRGACCCKCAYREMNEDPATRRELAFYCLEWQEPFTGDAGHVCGRFALDRTRYHDLHTLQYQARGVEDGPQRTLGDWGVERCSG